MWGTTRKRYPFRYDYKLNNNSLKHFTQVKDLGVTISPDLKWDTHINTFLSKANRMLAFLRRNSVMEERIFVDKTNSNIALRVFRHFFLRQGSERGSST